MKTDRGLIASDETLKSAVVAITTLFEVGDAMKEEVVGYAIADMLSMTGAMNENWWNEHVRSSGTRDGCLRKSRSDDALIVVVK